MRTKRLIPLVLATTLGLTLTACGGGNKDSDPMADGKITIGTVGENPSHKALKEVAEKNGITVEFVDFSDFSQPNPAVASGEIDMNWFQHVAYLADYNNNSGEKVTPVGSTAIYPLGLYSKEYKSVSDFVKGDEIAVPNDSINQGRALKLLEQEKLVVLKKDTIAPSETDVDTEKSLVKIRPVSAEQTVISMDSVKGSVVNNTFLQRGDVDPKNALAQDNPETEASRVFVNIFAAKDANADNEDLKKVAGFYYDQAVLDAEAKESKDTAVPTKVDQSELKQILERYQDDLKGQSK